MPTFILSLNWTDQGIRGVKEAPKRSKAARDLAKKLVNRFHETNHMGRIQFC
jgi:uncharacterized protein with GYD domain